MTTSTNGTTGAAQHASIPNVASFPSQGGASVRGGGEATANSSGATVTITEENQQQQQVEVLHLSLRARPSVRWDENVIDNEGLGRKSSKRCCIFHKQRSFGESSTDSSDYDSDRSGSSSVSSTDGDNKKKKSSRKPRKIARPKKEKNVPDFQRYHA